MLFLELIQAPDPRAAQIGSARNPSTASGVKYRSAAKSPLHQSADRPESGALDDAVELEPSFLCC